MNRVLNRTCLTLIPALWLVGCTDYPELELSTDVLLSAETVSFKDVNREYGDKLTYCCSYTKGDGTRVEFDPSEGYYLKVRTNIAEVRKVLYSHSCGNGKRCSTTELIDKLAEGHTPRGKYYSSWSVENHHGTTAYTTKKWDGYNEIYRTIEYRSGGDEEVILLGPIPEKPKTLTLNVRNLPKDNELGFPNKFTVKVVDHSGV